MKEINIDRVYPLNRHHNITILHDFNSLNYLLNLMEVWTCIEVGLLFRNSVWITWDPTKIGYNFLIKMFKNVGLSKTILKMIFY